MRCLAAILVRYTSRPFSRLLTYDGDEVVHPPRIELGPFASQANVLSIRLRVLERRVYLSTWHILKGFRLSYAHDCGVALFTFQA